MRCTLTWLLTGVCSLPLTGCGSGGLTQDDMRKHAIRRRSSDDEDKNPAAATVTQSRQEALTDALAGSPRDNRTAKAAPPAVVQQEDAPSLPAVDVSARAHAQSGAEKSDVHRTAKVETPAASPALSDEEAKPTQPLSPLERRQRTIDNLNKIGDAVRRYTEERRQLFPSASYDAYGKPMLSWRVELLPYLGCQKLYEEFRPDQPWDSPHNKALLARIPAPYQSPERFDEKTNYLAPTASFALFGHRPQGVTIGRIEDGLANTVVVVEVDDAAAVPWTQPVDVKIELNQFRQQVEALREDGFFVVWLDGSVGCISRDCPDADLKAIFTYDAGDMISAFGVRGAATATPVANLSEASQGNTVPQTPVTPPETMESAARANKVPLAAIPSATNATQPIRLPIPDPLSRERARELVRELYKKEYDSHKKVAQQREMADRMLKQAVQMSDDPAGHYVLLETAIKIATRIGDTATAFSALDDLIASFQVDELSTTHEVLVPLAKKDRTRVGVSMQLAKSRSFIDKAVEREQFEIGESLCQIATGAARQLGDRDAANQLQRQAEFVEQSRKALRGVQRILATLGDKDDPEAHLQAGRYYCFTKGEWEKGLPFLAKGSDSRLKQLAAAELTPPTVPADQLELADGWWNLAASEKAYQAAFQRRAVYWYQRVLPGLPSGLWRAKTELRLNEFNRHHGSAVVAPAAK
ncbi:MAG: DUF1559 family PulG-like putative transporter [Pirellulaceae bacterium]